MKNAPLFISIAALVVAVVFGIVSLSGKNCKKVQEVEETAPVAAGAGTTVYFQLDQVLQRYDMANDLSSVVETKVQNIQNTITSKQKKLEKEYNDFSDQMNKGLMTRSVAEVKAQELEKKKADFEQYASQKQQEIMEEQQVMMNQIGDAIQTFITSYNEEKQFAMIIANQAGSPIIIADPALDITEEVIAGLNEEYVKSKSSKSEKKKEE